MRTDLTRWRAPAVATAALERVPYLVVLDSDLHEVEEFATVVLPIGTYAEMDGTFTNHAGRVQRIRRAVAPPGEARPGWRALGELAALVDGGAPPESAAAVFDLLVGEGAPFRGLTWSGVGELGQVAGS